MQYPMQALRPGLQFHCQVDKLILEQSTTPGKAIRYLGGNNGFIVHTHCQAQNHEPFGKAFQKKNYVFSRASFCALSSDRGCQQAKSLCHIVTRQ